MYNQTLGKNLKKIHAKLKKMSEKRSKKYTESNFHCKYQEEALNSQTYNHNVSTIDVISKTGNRKM